MRALAAHGVAVPDEISVTGFDDDPIAEWTSPALTTVRQDFAEMGRHAYALLNARLTDPAAAPRHDDVAVTLIPRQSVTQLRAAKRIG
jgi:DNA-binding LacI/PurR family transcriptional regulator